MRSSSAAVTLVLSFVTQASLPAQSLESLTLRFAGFTTVSGYEQAVTDSLVALFPGATRDRLGDVSVTLGSGAPRRLVSCPLDEAGYAVGGITAEGYLTLRREGRVTNPLFEQQLEGHRVVVFGASGAIPGVVGVRSVHLTRGRAANEAPFTADDAYVDIGATSAADAATLGVRMLSPVALDRKAHRYGDGVAAPAVGRHAACAALAAALLSHPKIAGSLVASFTVQGLQSGNPGLGSVTALKGPFADTLTATLPVKYRETAAETVLLSDVQALEQRILQWIGGAK
jgi:putative aminopeptidase FrvX